MIVDEMNTTRSFSVINNFGTPQSTLQINFGLLQFDIENSATEQPQLIDSQKLLIRNGKQQLRQFYEKQFDLKYHDAGS